MGMIFPGMDPYLENPGIWPGVHTRFIVYLAEFLQPLLRPRYIASIDERVYMEGPERHVIPDVNIERTKRPTFALHSTAVADAATPIKVRIPPVEVHERYVAILHRESGLRIVTVIELLSPTNKYAGPGRDSYLEKQKEVLASDANLLEVDLLRFGPHVLAVAEYAARALGPYEYMACTNRVARVRAEFELLPMRLRQPLPRIRIPLMGNDENVVVDLQAVLTRVYEASGYEDQIDYGAPCVPRLSPEDQQWANELIQKARQVPQQPSA